MLIVFVQNDLCFEREKEEFFAQVILKIQNLARFAARVPQNLAFS